MDDLKVVPIGKPNLADIAAMLEHTAKRIRSGDIEPASRAVVVLLVGGPGEHRVQVMDFGPSGADDASSTMLGALGMMAAAQFQMLGAAN